MHLPPPNLYAQNSIFFFRVGLCPTRYLPFAGDVAAYQAWDSIITVEIAWTRVHAISDYNTCLKEENKWMKIEGLPCDTWKTLERWIFIAVIFSHPRDCDPTVAVMCDRDHPLHLQISSDGVGDAWKNTTISARSSLDRGDSGAGSMRIRLPLIGKRSTKLERHD